MCSYIHLVLGLGVDLPQFWFGILPPLAILGLKWVMKWVCVVQVLAHFSQLDKWSDSTISAQLCTAFFLLFLLLDMHSLLCAIVLLKIRFLGMSKYKVLNRIKEKENKEFEKKETRGTIFNLSEIFLTDIFKLFFK